jgi:hypothetical protein
MLLCIVLLEVEMNNYPYQMKMQTSFYKYQYTNRVLCAELEKCLFVEHIMNLQYWEHGCPNIFVSEHRMFFKYLIFVWHLEICYCSWDILHHLL